MKYKVAIVGTTGAVGQEMIKMLEKSEIPVASLKLFASQRSAGKKLKFKNEEFTVEELKHDSIENVDIALFSAGGAISKEFCKEFVKKGAFVIDNSSAWRMDPEVPLVVPEINPQTITKETKLISNPNCSTIQMLIALYPIYQLSRIKTIRVATYQSVSGAGGMAMNELYEQTRSIILSQEVLPAKKLPQRIAFNVIPQIDVFEENRYTKEEMKMVNETKKILNDYNIKVSATCVRVPVFRGHSEAIWIETEKKLQLDEVYDALNRCEHICVIDDPFNKKYPMPIDVENKTLTFVGRIREDLASETGLLLWVVADNLLKGAAYNAVQIAELLVKNNIC